MHPTCIAWIATTKNKENKNVQRGTDNGIDWSWKHVKNTMPIESCVTQPADVKSGSICKVRKISSEVP